MRAQSSGVPVDEATWEDHNDSVAMTPEKFESVLAALNAANSKALHPNLTMQQGSNGNNAQQQPTNQVNSTSTLQSVWDPSIADCSQARTWLSAHPLKLKVDQGHPENDDVATERHRLSHHAKSLFDALPSAPPDAASDWASPKREYYNRYQANGIYDLQRLLSTREGCMRAQSQCFLVVERAFTLHGSGVSAGSTQMKLDSKSKLSDRIGQMIKCFQIKRVAIDIILGKMETHEQIVKNPVELLKTRLHCADNNATKASRNVAGAKALGTSTKASRKRSMQPAASARRTKSSNFEMTSTSQATVPTVPASDEVPEDPADIWNYHALALKRRLKNIHDQSCLEISLAAVKRRKSQQGSDFDSGYVTPNEHDSQATPLNGQPQGYFNQAAATTGWSIDYPGYNSAYETPPEYMDPPAFQSRPNTATNPFQQLAPLQSYGYQPIYSMHGHNAFHTSQEPSWDTHGDPSEHSWPQPSSSLQQPLMEPVQNTDFLQQPSFNAAQSENLFRATSGQDSWPADTINDSYHGDDGVDLGGKDLHSA